MERRTVLVVDDEPIFTGAAKKVLSRAGYEVATAGALSGALALLHNCRFDAVITDLSLEGTRGQEGLAIARTAKARNPAICVILVTAFGSDEVRRKADEVGIELQLDKPVSLAHLVEVLAGFGVTGAGAGADPGWT